MKMLLLNIAICLIVLITSSVNTKKLVINTDAGADDAAAILLILSAEASNDTDFHVIAVTCSYGNTKEENVVDNVRRILTIADRPEIPIYKGSVKPLKYNFTTDSLFGNNGFGDVDFEDEVTASVDESKHAASALAQLARKYPGELSILSLGPTTNIALAVSLDPQFIRNVDRFYIMGGSVAGLGNYSPGIEFNFAADPDSNFIVFNSTSSHPLLLYPWETFKTHAITRQWRLEVLGTINSTIINFLNLVERKAFTKIDSWACADTITAALMMWPHLITKSIIKNVTPVYDGESKGSLLVDYANKTDKIKNTKIVLETNIEKIKQLLVRHYGQKNIK